MSLSHEELSLLLGGIDLRRTRRKDWYRKTISEERKRVRKSYESNCIFVSYFHQLSSSFTPLKMQDPELVSQLKEKLPEALFEKLNDSLSIDRDRLKFAEYKVRVLEERLRLATDREVRPRQRKTLRRPTGTLGVGAWGQQRRNPEPRVSGNN